MYPHMRCRTCRWRVSLHQRDLISYSCDFAMLTGTTRLGTLLRKHGKKCPDDEIHRQMKPENCPFYEKGPRAQLNYNRR